MADIQLPRLCLSGIDIGFILICLFSKLDNATMGIKLLVSGLSTAEEIPKYRDRVLVQKSNVK